MFQGRAIVYAPILVRLANLPLDSRDMMKVARNTWVE